MKAQFPVPVLRLNGALGIVDDKLIVLPVPFGYAAVFRDIPSPSNPAVVFKKAFVNTAVGSALNGKSVDFSVFEGPFVCFVLFGVKIYSLSVISSVDKIALIARTVRYFFDINLPGNI